MLRLSDGPNPHLSTAIAPDLDDCTENCDGGNTDTSRVWKSGDMFHARIGLPCRNVARARADRQRPRQGHLRAKRNDSSVYAAFKDGGRAMTQPIAGLVACAVALILVAGDSHAD